MKKQLRLETLRAREALNSEEVLLKSSSIITIFKESNFYKEAKNIMIYVSFRNEVDTLGLIEEMIQEGKRVFIPLTVDKTRELLVSEVQDIKEDLEIGNFGVLEPKKEKERILDPNILDLIVVPGVSFDKRGYRIGYGGGYYDRFLAKHNDITTLSLIFQLQLIDQVPNDTFDIPVDYLITEKELIKCKED
ncbi:5-formyltetrahydrofolate cyclo-ligase [Alkaliphilus serpentinus]|uniref:5-formyltetrahydrofolate cyclo-ligase n=1 Tax=Alkaliphilus serpentinus TaxID=1482731 RepID=A0A833HSL3_9FIRM|nr:5-formyltetrahydrofolate cyclo-ligase [Alkaliphilus serpentinus]KAB3533545.1 5-formyltetrahydrofolate cyclo-ligase [Alkaliphilus serpentinus]